MAKLDVFIDWLKATFNAKSISVFKNWENFYFVYLSTKTSSDTKEAMIHSTVDVPMVFFLWDGTSSRGFARQQSLQEKAGRALTYDGNMVLVHMPHFKNTSTVFPAYLNIDDNKARMVLKCLLKTLEFGDAVESINETCKEPDAHHAANTAFACCEIESETLTCKKVSVPKTFAGMKIQIDLAGYQQL